MTPLRPEQVEGFRRAAVRAGANALDMATLCDSYEAMRAALTVQTDLWESVGRHIDVAAIGYNHPQIAKVFQDNRALRAQVTDLQAQVERLQRDYSASQAHVAEVSLELRDAEAERDAISQQAQAHAQARELEQKDLQAALLRERGHLKEIADLAEQVERLTSLAKQATNGWACFATRKREHDDIARLHRQIAAVTAPADPPASSAVTAPHSDLQAHERLYWGNALALITEQMAAWVNVQMADPSGEWVNVSERVVKLRAVIGAASHWMLRVASSAVTGETPADKRLDSSHDWREVGMCDKTCATLQCWRCMIIAGESGADERCPLHWTAQPPSAAPVETPPHTLVWQQITTALTDDAIEHVWGLEPAACADGPEFRAKCRDEAIAYLVDAILAALPSPKGDQ